jgi:dihydropteroate synthase
LKETPTHWVISGGRVDLGAGVLVGVLNVTPDSFSDGGWFVESDTAIAHGVGMVESGASLVDVGGESTRPGALPVPDEEELQRLLPTVAGLVAAGIPVSVDTYKPEVARRALAEGAVVINDVTGFRNDEMVEVAASSDCGLVVMHMQGTPADMHIDPVYTDVVAEVEIELLASVQRLESAGVSPDRIVLDPGIGFGKRASHSLQLLANLGRLAGHGFPIMVGTSRKGFLGDLVGSDSRDRRDLATAVTTAIAFSRGARLFRVHDVPRSRDALSVAAAIVTNQ